MLLTRVQSCSSWCDTVDLWLQRQEIDCNGIKLNQNLNQTKSFAAATSKQYSFSQVQHKLLYRSDIFFQILTWLAFMDCSSFPFLVLNRRPSPAKEAKVLLTSIPAGGQVRPAKGLKGGQMFSQPFPSSLLLTGQSPAVDQWRESGRSSPPSLSLLTLPAPAASEEATDKGL